MSTVVDRAPLATGDALRHPAGGLAVSRQDLGRLAAAVTCVALGLPPDTLEVSAVVTLVRAWTVPVAAWRRDHLSWPPRWSRHERLTAGEPVGTGVPESWR